MGEETHGQLIHVHLEENGARVLVGEFFNLGRNELAWSIGYKSRVERGEGFRNRLVAEWTHSPAPSGKEINDNDFAALNVFLELFGGGDVENGHFF